MSSCMESIFRTLTNSLEAEKLHHAMIAKDKIVPIMPLQMISKSQCEQYRERFGTYCRWTTIEKEERRTIGRRQ